mmetsp:Transcript_1971/g.3205  ORF Transcript_1971/g.3205 Transcript_1971/m.3205 type:complete len:203 (-) Transcript_1971:576-1184(-)
MYPTSMSSARSTLPRQSRQKYRSLRCSERASDKSTTSMQASFSCCSVESEFQCSSQSCSTRGFAVCKLQRCRLPWFPRRRKFTALKEPNTLAMPIFPSFVNRGLNTRLSTPRSWKRVFIMLSFPRESERATFKVLTHPEQLISWLYFCKISATSSFEHWSSRGRSSGSTCVRLSSISLSGFRALAFSRLSTITLPLSCTSFF